MNNNILAALSPIAPAHWALPEVPRGSLVIVEGRAPIWRSRTAALHLLHASPTAAQDSRSAPGVADGGQP